MIPMATQVRGWLLDIQYSTVGQILKHGDTQGYNSWMNSIILNVSLAHPFALPSSACQSLLNVALHLMSHKKDWLLGVSNLAIVRVVHCLDAPPSTCMKVCYRHVLMNHLQPLKEIHLCHPLLVVGSIRPNWLWLTFTIFLGTNMFIFLHLVKKENRT